MTPARPRSWSRRSWRSSPGYAAIAFLLRYLVTHNLSVFVAYRIALGLVVIALAASGAIS